MWKCKHEKQRKLIERWKFTLHVPTHTVICTKDFKAVITTAVMFWHFSGWNAQTITLKYAGQHPAPKISMWIGKTLNSSMLLYVISSYNCRLSFCFRLLCKELVFSFTISHCIWFVVFFRAWYIKSSNGVS